MLEIARLLERLARALEEANQLRRIDMRGRGTLASKPDQGSK
jgi:hypothetical protein